MSQTNADRLLEGLAARLPTAQAIVVTNRFGVKLAENISLEGQAQLPSLTAAARVFAGLLAEATGRGQEEYISFYLDGGCYSVFEFGEHWIVGILTPVEQGAEGLRAVLSAIMLTHDPITD